MRISLARLSLVTAAILALAGSAQALINPNFTPIHLTQQSERILVLTFEGVDDDGMVVARVSETIKGEHDGETLRIDPEAAIAVGQSDAFVNAVERGQEYALLFVGEFEPGGFEGGEMHLDAEGPDAIGFLHIDGLPAAQWLVLENWPDQDGAATDIWDMVQSEAFLLATFNGGTDMLRRMLDYILTDPEADVPIDAQARWAEEAMGLGRVEGRVHAAQGIFLNRDGEAVAEDLFVASEGGDRVFRFDGTTMQDVTDSLGLASRSIHHAWADFTSNGKLDLASFDGEAITLHVQGDSGTFEAHALDLGDAVVADGVLSLDAIDTGNGAGLVVGTAGLPQVVSFDGQDASVRPLVEDAGDVEFPEDAGGLLVADFDGNGYVDVIQLGGRESLLYRGTGVGAFAAPEKSFVATGGGPHGAALGDLDQNGQLDIFIASDRRHLLWQNEGDMEFFERMMLSGEVSYKWTGEGRTAHIADLANDGRDDLTIHYAAARIPYILFNRGYRSFAHSLTLDMDDHAQLHAATEGQQAVTLGDFNGSGRNDFVAVLPDGAVWVLPQAVESPGLTVRASLAEGEAGPVNVRAWRFERELGVRQVKPGQPAFIGARHPGPIRLQWQYPGDEVREAEVILEGGPMRFELER